MAATPPALPDDDGHSVASSRMSRRSVVRLEVELPGGAEIKFVDAMPGSGPGWRAYLPPGLKTLDGHKNRFRSYRDPITFLGSARSSDAAKA